MHWTNIALVIIFGLNLGLALMVWLINPKNKINISFALSAFCFGLWSLMEALFRETDSEGLAFIFARFETSFGSLIVVFFTIFALFFPYQHKKINLFSKILFFVPILILFYLIWFTKYFIESVVILANNGNDFIFNIYGRIYFAIFMFVYPIIAFYWLIKKFFRSTNIFRVNIGYVLVGTGIVGVFCTIFGVIIPLIDGRNNPWYAPVFSIPMIIILTWFILIGNKKIYIK